MNETNREIFEVITQIRSHVELQRALGLTVIEIPSEHPSPVGSPLSSVPSSGPATTKDLQEKKPVAETRQEAKVPIGEDSKDCVQCKRGKVRKASVAGEGNPAARIVFIGEAPALDDNGRGKPFAGEAGQLLTDIIVKGMKLKREDVYLCTLVKCASPGTAPEPDEIAACQPGLIKQMKTIKPNIIIALGDVAAKTLAGSNESLSTLHGRWHEWQGFKVMPTFGPEYLLKNPLDKKIVWEDIKKVIAEMGGEKKATASEK
jgi:DNA polymerase